MKVLLPGILSTIKTPCCGVPYSYTSCPQCHENYLQDLIPLDRYLAKVIETTAPPGYVRDKEGTLHDKAKWIERLDKARTALQQARAKYVPTKRCRRCYKQKPITDYLGGRSLYDRMSNCKECYEIIKKKGM